MAEIRYIPPDRNRLTPMQHGAQLTSNNAYYHTQRMDAMENRVGSTHG